MRKKFVFANQQFTQTGRSDCHFGREGRTSQHEGYQMRILTFRKTADTLEGNALLKARYIFDNYHLDCFADDTGLEVEALVGHRVYIPPVMPAMHTIRKQT